MKKLLLAARIGALALIALSATACASIPGLGGGADPAISPRAAAVEAARRIVPVLKELPPLIAAGGVSDNLADDIVQYGPEVRGLLTTLLDGAEACVAIGGNLVSETSLGRECRPSPLGLIYDQLDGKMRDWAIKEGLDTKAGQAIWGGRLVLTAVPRPSAGKLTGYRDEPDVPLADFQALRADWAGAFDAVIATAAQRAAKK